ncbi:dihydrolipoyl dehydrogenase [Virgibacillus alimentarius]|uniref:Dihydrolipoyl dehydrogenase n=1 Tax=Virgibacillus alimentarius TaxID=698769 RepID=A0ABS4SC73_9BACI|nr:dihydrolipoyl dehydrogenase [Virgibacillus alimentarius]MBP2259107.1 dihydrolipoamide dehydrogenase [Virgibacillus alimentarius]
MVVGEIAESRDLVIIGGGPGGYNAAIRAAQLGLDVTIIEKGKMGGVCLNEGCIPSKVFAHAAKEYASVPNLSILGINIGEPTFDFHELMKYKDRTVAQLRKGVEALCAANKIEIIEGQATFTAENKIGVENGHQFDVYEFNHAIIATGSATIKPDFLPKQSDRVLFSDVIYNLDEMPQDLIVYGSNYISLEVAFSYHNLGANVTMILDETDDFSFDTSINRELKRILKKQKIKVHRGFKVEEVHASEDDVEVRLAKDGKEETLKGTHIYVATQHKADIAELGLERFGLKMTEDGLVETDAQMRTSLDKLFAVGDITEGTPSAVKAIKEGKVAAETIAGLNSEVDLTFLPTIVHSIPKIASVGLTEEEAVEAGCKVKTSQFANSGNSYAMITNEKSGITKIIKDEETDLLLGFHAIGAGAVELISTAVTALEMVGRDEDLNFPLYPHPSFNETILEAVEGLEEKAIHMPPPKKTAKV